MSVRPTKFDDKILSLQGDLNPVNESYRSYSYQRVPPLNSVKNWGSGTNLVYQLPQYNDSMYYLKDAYFDAQIKFSVKFDTSATTFTDANNQTINVAATSNNVGALEAYAPLSIDEFFFSSLVEDIQVSYGNTNITNVNAPPDAYPLAHSIYTMVTEEPDKHIGASASRNFLTSPIGGAGDPTDLHDYMRSSEPTERMTYNYRGSKNPYNMTLSLSKGFSSTGRLSANLDDYPVWFQNATTGDVRSPFLYGETSLYLSNLIHDNTNTLGVIPDAVLNTTLDDPVINVTMKCKIPMFDSEYKYPANLPLNVTLRRSKSVLYSIGESSFSQIAAWLVTGKYIGDPTLISKSSFEINFESMDLYVKRLVMTDQQRSILFKSPELIYDLRDWHCQVFTITGNNINHNLSFQSRPTILLVGLVPASSLNPVVPTHVQKEVSSFHTSNHNDIGFSSLYINTNIGKIPESEYRPVDSNGITNVQQSGRAYHEFKKILKSEELTYEAWLNNYQYYTFIVNTDDENPQEEASIIDRTTINIVGQVVRNQLSENQDHKLVVMGMTQSTIKISNFTNVIVNI